MGETLTGMLRDDSQDRKSEEKANSTMTWCLNSWISKNDVSIGLPHSGIDSNFPRTVCKNKPAHTFQYI